jgi:uncharacterized membrane protein
MGKNMSTATNHGNIESVARKQAEMSSIVLWVLIAIYAAARVLQISPGVPMLAVVALHVFPPAIFALMHGAKLYQWRGSVMFVALCVVVGNIFENLSILTGFPFGHYYFTDVMGPKLLHVPILLGLAYVGMGYLSWTLARVILGSQQAPVGWRVVTLPLIASFIMVAWDFSMEPVWATILHSWIWLQGGAYFGVPISNFLGWYLTVYVTYQMFALYLRRHPTNRNPLPPGYWYSAVVFYGISAAGNILLAIPRAGQSVVSDNTGAQWKVSDITGTCALVTIFTMGAFAVLAWVRLMDTQGSK